jgi:threonylcarbamoyladenosine tRNA methylthiotransferase MtaB
MSVEVLTFGCRLNAHESDAMRSLAWRAGHCGVVLVNTCAVTAEAEKQARKAIRAAHRRNPAAPIHVTGCAAQIAPERWAALPGVVRVVPNARKLDPGTWARASAAAPLAGTVGPPAGATSADAVPDLAAPRSGALGIAAPEDAAPRDVAPKDVAPRHLAPRHLAPRDAAPRDAAPGEIEPADVAPGPAAPADASPVTAPAPIVSGSAGGRTRAFLQVQGGCDHACTFCVIPQGRGPSFSVPVAALAARLRRLVGEGHREAVLTGVDIASWGADLPGRPALGAALRRLLALVPDLPRLRLSSLDPAALDDDLWRLLAEEPRLMPHLHLSLQHGADLILKRMKRRHGRADALRAARRARDARPGLALGADLIAGFPTETEAHLRDTLDLVDEMDLSFLHVFPYSERPNTPAARMPQVAVPLRRERAARLRAAGAAAAARFYAGRVGREETVLFEAGNRGHTEHFAPLRLAEGAAPVPRGTIRRVRASASGPDGLLADGQPADVRPAESLLASGSPAHQRPHTASHPAAGEDR